jgi:hypothetical protein
MIPEQLAQLNRTDLRPAGPHKTTGQCTGVLALLENRDSGNERCFVPVHPLHEPTSAGRKIVHKFRLIKPQLIEVDQVHVGAQPAS